MGIEYSKECVMQKLMIKDKGRGVLEIRDWKDK